MYLNDQAFRERALRNDLVSLQATWVSLRHLRDATEMIARKNDVEIDNSDIEEAIADVECAITETEKLMMVSSHHA